MKRLQNCLELYLYMDKNCMFMTVWVLYAWPQWLPECNFGQIILYYRVPKCDITKNQICEIMGFGAIFKIERP